MTTRQIASARPYRLNLRWSPLVRKCLLLIHILGAGVWFGLDLALGVLVGTALLTDDPGTAGAALQAMRWFAVWPMFTASLVSLASGIMLGLGNKYGLLRYWWVAAKLAINLLMSTLILVALRPGLGEAADLGSRLAAADPTAQVPAGLLFPVIVAPSLLLIAYFLSVFKPRARIR